MQIQIEMWNDETMYPYGIETPDLEPPVLPIQDDGYTGEFDDFDFEMPIDDGEGE